MMRALLVRFFAAAMVVAGLAVRTAVWMAAAGNPEADRFWPQWRGPRATGTSEHATPPLEWSETKNVRWKVEIPGRGSSSPVVVEPLSSTMRVRSNCAAWRGVGISLRAACCQPM